MYKGPGATWILSGYEEPIESRVAEGEPGLETGEADRG